MKTIYSYTIKSFIGPFAATFCISIFVLLMQFLWVYIDDLVGKGLEWYVVLKFLFFTCVVLVPMALPLALLLSSLMTFGNLAEHYELVAMKSAGLSLQKIMRPLTITAFLISFGAFCFANITLPWANLKMQSMLFDITHSKPSLKLKEGFFYNGVKDYSIRVGHKSKDGKQLKDVMIYDHKSGQGNTKATFADSGRMEIAGSNNMLMITLYDGYSYEDILSNGQQQLTRPMMRTKFREETILFDLSDFKMNKTEESLFKNNYQMLNMVQLRQAMDSMKITNNKSKELTMHQLNTSNYARILQYLSIADTTKKKTLNSGAFFAGLSHADRARVLETAINIARTAKTTAEAIREDEQSNQQLMRKFEVELHKKFTLSIACLLLFFIGAPLGAIIRKGGLGMPVVVSVLFFLVFYVVSITGERLAKEGSLSVAKGMWLAPLLFLPIGIFLSFKASTDSSLFDPATYFTGIKKLLKKNNQEHP